MILELIKASALLLTLSLLYGFIIRFSNSNKITGQLFSGILFGVICIIGMLLPIELIPGVIFDPRSVIIALAGVFGGPLVTLIASVIAGGYRIWIGGGGVYVGVSVVITSALLGLLYRYGWQKGWLKITVLQLLLFGFIVHAIEILLFTQLPAGVVQQVMGSVALPLILTFTPATVILGLLLQDIENRFKTEAALAESESRLSLHLQNTPLAAISWDESFCCTQWNKAAEQIFGYSADEALGRHAMELVIPSQLKQELHKLFQQILTQNGGRRNINQNITKDGRLITCEWYNTPILNKEGKPVGLSSLCEDITQQKQAQDEIKLKNTLLVTQQEASMDGIFSLDAEGKIISINQRFILQWGVLPSVISSNCSEQVLATITKQLAEPDQFSRKLSYLYKNQTESSADEIVTRNQRIFESYSAPMFAQEGQYYGRVWWFRDITERKQSEELIWNQANFDPLTGLANRQMLQNQLEHEIKQAKRDNLSVALLYLDLDQFKEVNDTLGHDAGDLLLKQCADRLSAYIREADTLARLGGDEFTVIMSGLSRSSDVDRVANDILQQMAVPFELGLEKAYISTSIGITFYPQDATSAEQMLKNADQAMYSAKKIGRNCFQYFTPLMQEAAFTRMLMIKDLRNALPDGQFQLFYQPIIELSTGDIHKAEALLRWHHPVRGAVSPDKFIPIAEETRMIMEIGDWVFHQAAQQTALWRNAYCADFQISINTSPVQYLNEDFNIKLWLDHLKSLGLPGRAIAVEITEGLLMETMSKVTDKLFMFRDEGMQVSLDDFGTGYSSLSYLRKLHIDYIKIDRSFVQNLQPDSDDMSLCEAIIVMAHKLGLKVIAEGIETTQQRQLLSSAGCDYGQGYLFSRPVPADEFEQLLQTSQKVKTGAQPD